MGVYPSGNDLSRFWDSRLNLNTCTQCQERLGHGSGDSTGEIRRVLSVPPAPVVTAAASKGMMPTTIGKAKVAVAVGGGGRGQVFRVVHPGLRKARSESPNLDVHEGVPFLALRPGRGTLAARGVHRGPAGAWFSLVRHRGSR